MVWERRQTLAGLCLPPALGTAWSGHSRVMASCSDREDKLIRFPFRPKLGDEGRDQVSVCPKTEVNDLPPCSCYAQNCSVITGVQLSHCVAPTDPAEAGVSSNVSRWVRLLLRGVRSGWFKATTFTVQHRASFSDLCENVSPV